MYNEISFRFQTYIENKKSFIATELLVDGRPLVNFDAYALDWHVLVDSCGTREGEHFIITCTCGVTGCAGIRDGILIRDDGFTIYWTVRSFQPVQRFRFERESYRSEIVRAFKVIQAQYAENPDRLRYYEHYIVQRYFPNLAPAPELLPPTKSKSKKKKRR